jgi:hypothetical protein
MTRIVRRQKRVARSSEKKIQLFREWGKDLNRWRIPNTFMNDCFFVEAQTEEQKMYLRGAFDAVRNVLKILERKETV